MKKYSLFLITILLITISSSFQQAVAQDKTKAEQEKDAKIQQSIEQSTNQLQKTQNTSQP